MDALRSYFGVALGLAACGAHKEELPPPDGAGPPSGTVSITVKQGPAATPVIFVDADETVVASTTTDANGFASATMHEGGSVNVFTPNTATGGGGIILTYASVELGDAFVLDLSSPAVTHEVDATLTLPAVTGATSYSVSALCGGGGQSTSPTVPIELYGCGATTDMFVAAQDGTNLLAAAFIKDVPVATAISLTDAVFVTAAPVTVNLTNLPADISPLVDAWLYANGVQLVHYVCGFATATATSCQFTAPLLAGVDLALGVETVRSDSSAQVTTGRVPLTTSTTIDCAANAMTWTSVPVVDAAGGNVTWTETGQGPIAIDGEVIETESSVMASPNPLIYDRFTSAPHAGTLVHIPRLPAPYDLFDVGPATEYVGMFPVGFGQDYSALRLAPFQLRGVDRTLFEHFPSGHFDHVGVPDS